MGLKRTNNKEAATQNAILEFISLKYNSVILLCGDCLLNIWHIIIDMFYWKSYSNDTVHSLVRVLPVYINVFMLSLLDVDWKVIVMIQFILWCVYYQFILMYLGCHCRMLIMRLLWLPNFQLPRKFSPERRIWYLALNPFRNFSLRMRSYCVKCSAYFYEYYSKWFTFSSFYRLPFACSALI